jgi:hypothetical protein
MGRFAAEEEEDVAGRRFRGVSGGADMAGWLARSKQSSFSIATEWDELGEYTSYEMWTQDGAVPYPKCGVGAG